MNPRDSDHPPADPRDLLASYAAVLELPVHWGEQDPNGHVNHAAPVRWLESARIAFIRGSSVHDVLQRAGLAPLLAELQCSYRRQIHFPDRVLIGSRVAEIGRSTLFIEQAVVSCQQAAVAIEARVRVVIFDPVRQRPVRIPADIAKLLRDSSP